MSTKIRLLFYIMEIKIHFLFKKILIKQEITGDIRLSQIILLYKKGVH